MSAPGRELAEQEVKKYIDRNLARFHRVRFIRMIHLPCFTDTDRQKISAIYAHEGNNLIAFDFFQLLCCREGWVMPFVDALRQENMGDLANELESLYRSKLLPPSRTRPPAPPSQPEPMAVAQAISWSPSRSAAPSASLPHDTGDWRTPVQENSHPAEKLAGHPKTTDKGAEPGSASAVGDRASESSDPHPVKEKSASLPGPVEERPLPSQTISTSVVGRVEQNWDGRQHRPVTVKNGCFGNASRPEDSGTGSALPTSASGSQPEENYYSSDSVSLVLDNRREASPGERKVHVIRGDREEENPPVVTSLLDAPPKNLPASQGSPENETLPFVDPSSRSAPANDAQPSLLPRTGTQPPLLVPDAAPERPIRLLPSDLHVETKSAKPRRGVSAAGGDRPSGDFKLPVEENRSWEETTQGTVALAGRPQWGTETRPSTVGGPKRDSTIFHSNYSENDMPSKPGVLSSVLAAEPSKLSSDDAGKTSHMYSGSSDRLCMSNGDSVSVSTCDSNPILISEVSSVGHSTGSATQGRNGASDAADAALPPKVDAGEEDTSVRSHQVVVEENPSVDLMGVPMDGASSRPAPGLTSDGQPLNKVEDHQRTSSDFRMLWAGFALALLASAAFVMYKKK